MTPEVPPQPQSRFIRDGLPWVVGAAALAVYLASLNPWVTLDSLPLAAKVAGWDWRPMLFQPVLFLVTCPFRWLPAAAVPLALNLFTAVCAALTLALLARSVALLPHDRLEPQRALVGNAQALLALPSAWVPAVLAVTVGGLQLTFWEHATAASGEMLDLLIFAGVIWCLLESRLDHRQTWLNRTAFIFGLGMANNWALVGFLPLFLLAVVWNKGLRFFKKDFLLRMALLGLAGLSLFLLLPLVQWWSGDTTVGFWRLLRSTAGSYKGVLATLSSQFLVQHRDVALLLAITSLFPVLVLSIRWGSFAGGDSVTTLGLGTLVFHASHACLLLACVWVAFDPAFSPSQMGRQTGLLLPFLPLYYLGALSVGYYSGFFLLMFGATATRHSRRGRVLRRVLRWTVPKLVYALLFLALAGLAWKNAPAIRARNLPLLEQYGEGVAKFLPPEGAVVLSDDPVCLRILQAALARQGKADRYVPVEAQVLPAAIYRAYLQKAYPEQWLEAPAGPQLTLAGLAPAPTDAVLDGAAVNRLLTRVAQTSPIYYLQPGFGFTFERFYLQQHGLVYEAKVYGGESLDSPPLTPEELAENEAFWDRAIATNVAPVLKLAHPDAAARPALRERLLSLAHLTLPPPPQAIALARWYSSALNFWGVELQRNNDWREATRYFALARQLKPDNVPAQVNLECNSNFLARVSMTVGRGGSLETRFGKYRDWNQILAGNGPVDEPSFCYALGRWCMQVSLARQAAQQFARLKTLAPRYLPARLLLADLFNRCDMPNTALKVAAEIRTDPGLQPLDPTNAVDLAFVEATAWFAKTNSAEADTILDSLVAAYPEDAALFDRVVRFGIAHESCSNALRLVDRRLAQTPDDPSALLNRGVVFLRTDSPSNAIPPLTRALALTNAPTAHLNRAIAYWKTGQIEAAQADYQAVLRAVPTAYQAYFGLADIALHRGDTNAAIRYYQGYLSNSIPGAEETSLVESRLQELRAAVR